jgi:hypothetical protein
LRYLARLARRRLTDRIAGAVQRADRDSQDPTRPRRCSLSALDGEKEVRIGVTEVGSFTGPWTRFFDDVLLSSWPVSR